MSDDSTGPKAGKLADLGPRVASGLGMALVGIAAIYFGGMPFTLLVALCVGVMIWELARICGSQEPLLLGSVAGISCFLVLLLPAGYGLPFLMLPAFIGVARLEERKVAFALFATMILLAGYGLVHVRVDFGAFWMVWLISVVIATDVAGYFAGRLIGGPKFWPKVSPKKTWSGTVAGWVAAGLVGFVVLRLNGGGGAVIGLSVALSMASQLGDICESALKRRAGVKDSSALLPGHGGLLDRFDGVLGAMVLFLMIEQVVEFPPLPPGM